MEPVPYAVRQFLAEHVASVALLDALLLLRATPDKVWTAREIGNALVSSEAIGREQLLHLCDSGLAVEREPGAYAYRPGPNADVIEQLADCYSKRRHTVIGIVYGSDARQASILSRGFRLRRRDP